ncbi:MAG TPA: hypothetical protein VIW68_00745 [Candidatus Sulfotelmatobacter sp.]
MLRLRVLVRGLLLFCVLAALPLYGVRRPDVDNSQNGEVFPASLCPDSVSTPFFAPLDGTQVPPTTCTPTSDPNKPNPPSPFPNLSVTLSGSNFTVTVTPALWQIGLGKGNSNAASKHTVLQVEFSGQPGMTLQSLVIGAELNGAAYVPCVPAEFGTGIPYCVALDNTLNDSLGTQWAIEPTATDLADTKTTRWDFSRFSSGTLALVVNGYPSEFSKIDRYPNSNLLTAASFIEANFLAVVTDASNNVFTAGGLTLPKAPAATNDLFANAIKITKVPFKSFLDTSATGPTEILSGTGAGGQADPQGDPIPQDPAQPNAGTPCGASWPSGSNSVFRSVWYTFTPSTSENYTIKTANSRYDTGVYVFTGSPSSPTTVACNDDAPTSNTGIAMQSSFVNFGATAGITYYVMVSEAPPPAGTDQNGNPIASPLANDATLDFNLAVGSSLILQPNTVLNFPATPVKTSSSGIVITATNTTSKSATISKFTLSASGAQDFKLSNDTCTILGPGAQCSITVTFAPLVVGPHTAYLQLIVSGGVSPTPITLNGTGD